MDNFIEYNCIDTGDVQVNNQTDKKDVEEILTCCITENNDNNCNVKNSPCQLGKDSKNNQSILSIGYKMSKQLKEEIKINHQQNLNIQSSSPDQPNLKISSGELCININKENTDKNNDHETSIEIGHSDNTNKLVASNAITLTDNTEQNNPVDTCGEKIYCVLTDVICNNPDDLNKMNCLDVENDKASSQYSLLKKFDINPTPDEFDLVRDNCLCEYSLKSHNSHLSGRFMLSHSDSSIVISNNNALPQAENVVSSNCSLAQLKSYGSDDSLDKDSLEMSKYREAHSEINQLDKDTDSDSSSSSSSTSLLISDSSDSDSDDEYENFKSLSCQPIKAKSELDLQDLPPIEDLKISVREEDCTPIGKVFQIVDQLVVIQAFRELPAYDLDTVLFTEGGQPLGKIFDVFGPVTEPLYCVRFNSREHIREKNIDLNQTVYSAPKTKYTNYIFLTQLMKLKGSDASWIDDDEPPEIYLEFSDDEQEQLAKKKKFKNRRAVFKIGSDPDEPARKRHFAYERRMNERNLQLSANKKNYGRSHVENCNNVLWSPIVQPPPRPKTFNVPSSYQFQDSCHRFGKSPVFNTRVPPPNVTFPLQFRPPMPDPSIGHLNQHFVNAKNSYVTAAAELPKYSNSQSYTFHPFQTLNPATFINNGSCNTTSYPNTMQQSPTFVNTWAASPSTSSNYSLFSKSSGTNTTSPLWISKPPPSPAINSPSGSILPPRVPYESSHLPPPIWNKQSPTQLSNRNPSNSSSVIFNPHVPPPSPHGSNY